ALRENINADKVSKKHFEKAFQKVKPSVSEGEMKSYDKAFKKGDEVAAYR
ncbi:MAG: hypothetical protein FJY77_05280, partial [Candidatus Altiarchaeales archaeon]|nr:hypothetical protein [Candidatus Altiarchaeales archaeon]